MRGQGHLEVRQKRQVRSNTVQGHDKSATDWAMCCKYFEDNPSASTETAKKDLEGKFLARRPNQDYYETLTVANAQKKCTRRLAEPVGEKGTSAAAPCPSKVEHGEGDRTATVADISKMIRRVFLMLTCLQGSSESKKNKETFFRRR